MSALADGVVAPLLVAVVVVCAVAAVGLLVAREATDRLHLSGVVTSVAVVLATAAAILDGVSAAVGVELALVCVVVVTTGPVITHALARAFRVRAEQGWTLPELEESDVDGGG